MRNIYIVCNLFCKGVKTYFHICFYLQKIIMGKTQKTKNEERGIVEGKDGEKTKFQDK